MVFGRVHESPIHIPQYGSINGHDCAIDPFCVYVAYAREVKDFVVVLQDSTGVTDGIDPFVRRSLTGGNEASLLWESLDSLSQPSSCQGR
jgi:hypothetical protein